MDYKKTINYLSISIAVLSAIAASAGIFSDQPEGPLEIQSIRGTTVQLYGKGFYRHMSAEVAPQGIAQDYVTLFVAIPLLLFSLYRFNKKGLRSHILLAGVLGYFMTTYLFYTMIAMYNELFLLWVVLLSLCFHGFYLVFTSINHGELREKIPASFPRRFLGGFLIFNSVSIGLLWLSIVLPHSVRGTIPPEVEHYTTLVVQALDLALALPIAFIAGYLLLKRNAFGYKLAMVYCVFLALQMSALTAKVIAMGLPGYNIIPVVFIIPSFLVLAITACFQSIRKLPDESYSTHPYRSS